MYHVGDQVRIRKDLAEGMYGDIEYVTEEMLEYAGEVAIVTGILDDHNTYQLSCDSGEWFWPKEVLELFDPTVQHNIAAEATYTVEQCLDALTQAGDSLFHAVANKDRDEFSLILGEYLGKPKNHPGPAPNNAKDLLSEEEITAYCTKCADTVQNLYQGILDKVGHGESETSALGAMAFFMQKELMYRYEIPNVIKGILKEKTEKKNEEERRKS